MNVPSNEEEELRKTVLLINVPQYETGSSNNAGVQYMFCVIFDVYLRYTPQKNGLQVSADWIPTCQSVRKAQSMN
jgi:hypothetical protein